MFALLYTPPWPTEIYLHLVYIKLKEMNEGNHTESLTLGR